LLKGRSKDWRGLYMGGGDYDTKEGMYVHRGHRGWTVKKWD